MSTSSANPELRNLPDFAEFMNLVRAQDPENPVMVDADLLEEVFGDGTTSRNGASEDFVRSLKHVTEQELLRQDQDLYAQSCPVCQLSYAEILTEQEYAESTDHYIGGANADLGLRRLPCQKDTGDQEASLGGHIMCGRCARKWLRLQNTCPMCRSVMDPSVAVVGNGEDGTDGNPDPMLELFQRLFSAGHQSGHGSRNDDSGLNRRGEDREEFTGMYS